MARIRSVKPDFFRHEGLQDLESANPGSCVMLVFAGLWGHCDKAGRFRWRPRTLKLDILPFVEFSMASTLELLRSFGFLRRYQVEGDDYGVIDTFEEHQRISGKEAQEPERFPAPSEGSIWEAPEKQLGEQEGNGVQEEEWSMDICPSKPEPLPKQDAEEPLRIYNEAAEAVGWPQARSLTATRRRQIHARLLECDGVEGWRNAMARARASPFLRGDEGRENGHTNWTPTLDFYLQPATFLKLLEGGYDDRKQAEVNAVLEKMFPHTKELDHARG